AGGSSPRMWGTQLLLLVCVQGERFIPTHVGNTARKALHSLAIPVHPHACGEHGKRVGEDCAAIGSSPRMWGTLTIWASPMPSLRFIPTHVGNTAPVRRGWRQRSVHPHACGEHRAECAACGTSTGSSPRMWGTPEGRPRPILHRRFIPTHVGNT